jgi:TolC family type I secretion outer membrane protein
MKSAPTRLALRMRNIEFLWGGLFGLFLALSTPALALDLSQAFSAAQERDLTILAARASARGARERIPQAFSQLLPSVSASVGRNQNQLTSTTPDVLGQAQTSEQQYASSNRSVSVRQPLYRPYQMEQYRQAQAQVRESDALLEDEEKNLAVRVAASYFDALLAAEQLALIEAQKRIHETYLDVAKKKLAVGEGTRTDSDEAQTRLDMTHALEIEARENVDYTLQQLQALIGQPVGKLAPLRATRLELAEPQPNRVDSWIERGEANNRRFQSLRDRLDAAQMEVKKASFGHYPTLDAVAQWSRSDSENVANVNSRYTNTSLGLQLNVPLYAGGGVNSSVRQALAGVEFAEQSLAMGRRDLALSVRKEYRGINESIAKIKALEQALRSSDQLILANQKSMQAGTRTMVDVLNAEQLRAGVVRDLAQFRYNYLMSRIKLLALVNAADGAAIDTVNQVFKIDN